MSNLNTSQDLTWVLKVQKCKAIHKIPNREGENRKTIETTTPSSTTRSFQQCQESYLSITIPMPDVDVFMPTAQAVNATALVHCRSGQDLTPQFILQMLRKQRGKPINLFLAFWAEVRPPVVQLLVITPCVTPGRPWKHSWYYIFFVWALTCPVMQCSGNYFLMDFNLRTILLDRWGHQEQLLSGLPNDVNLGILSDQTIKIRLQFSVRFPHINRIAWLSGQTLSKI